MPAALKLAGNEVHVWWLSVNESAVERLHDVLAEEEHNRAMRYHFPQDRERFVVARGTLRIILGGYLDLEPQQVVFRYGSHGKPALAGDFDLRFNVSYSHELILYAFTRGCGVGVDVERIQADVPVQNIANRFFSQAEVAELNRLTSKIRRDAFYNCWTRKEAYIKAKGEGLSYPLDHFTVSLLPGAPAALLWVDGDKDEVSRWALLDLNLHQGYKAAVCVRNSDLNVSCRRWHHAI